MISIYSSFTTRLTVRVILFTIEASTTALNTGEQQEKTQYMIKTVTVPELHNNLGQDARTLFSHLLFLLKGSQKAINGYSSS